MTRTAGRVKLMTMVQEAVAGGARRSEVCRCIGLSERTLQRWQQIAELKITPSHSRPRVSNDNAHVESLFRTLKYVPSWPEKGFATLEDARAWVESFVGWYNEEHRHSGIRYVTPGHHL